MHKQRLFRAIFWLTAAAVATSCGQSDGANSRRAITMDTKIESRIDKVMKEMDVRDKAGQLVQLSVDVLSDRATGKLDTAALRTAIRDFRVGSILNVVKNGITRDNYIEAVGVIQDMSMAELGIPCIYGLDMIHGASYYDDGTLFPQEINLGATFDPAFAAAMGKAIGYETRAGMVPWVFSPVMDLTRNPLWPRNWESFGEDPLVQSVMAAAETRAIQGDDPNHIDAEHCAVSIKHYMGYGAPASGKDRTPAWIAESELREKYFAPFKACIEAGALTVMVNSACINGIPTHANGTLLTGWLKEGLNWDGMVVTDWADINNLWQRDHVAKDAKDALRMGICAGIDMIMDPYNPTITDTIAELVEEGSIPESRLDDAVRRILRLKFRLGLFDAPVWDKDAYADYGCDEFKKASLQAAVESAVLLKNEDGTLPLRKDARILLTGPGADHMRTLNGGWTYTWQGSGQESYTMPFNTIYEAMNERFSNVRLVPGVVYDDNGNWQNDIAEDIPGAVAAARASDVIVACLGENSYCETPGNIDDLTISANQSELLNALAATGKPIVLILTEGRPRVIRELEPLCDAVVDAMLPGNYGGDALALLLGGDENFSGKLPFTYPKWVNSLHTYDYKVSEYREVMDGEYNYDAVMDVQWPFGHGLSYTTFEYSDLEVRGGGFKSGDVLNVSVKVTNTGSTAGKESVLLYSSDLVSSLVPDVRRLRAFTKVELKPGQSETVKFKVPADDLAYVGADGKWILEEGEFRLSVGGLAQTVECKKTKIWKTQNK